jgi:hypothetical protein
MFIDKAIVGIILGLVGGSLIGGNLKHRGV